MTQEEKELLLKDLCGRLPYGVKGKTLGCKVCTLRYVGIDGDFTANTYHGWIGRSQFIPYLRPLSSMTEAEREEYKRMLSDVGFTEFHKTADKILDFLYKNHFDVHGFIPKGMAIEVTSENNPYKA